MRKIHFESARNNQPDSALHPQATSQQKSCNKSCSDISEKGAKSSAGRAAGAAHEHLTRTQTRDTSTQSLGRGHQQSFPNMMEKLNPTGPPVSPCDLPHPSSPSCDSVEQHSPLHNKTLSFKDAISGPRPANKKGHKGHMDVSSPGTLKPVLMETREDKEEGEKRAGAKSTTAPDASANGSPTLSSPPPLLPAPAKASVASVASVASFPPCSLSSPLPPHIPVISLGHSKPPLRLPNTPLTALHPIPNLRHGPRGDLRGGQRPYLPVANLGASGGSSTPSPAHLLHQQYLSPHPFFTR